MPETAHRTMMQVDLAEMRRALVRFSTSLRAAGRALARVYPRLDGLRQLERKARGRQKALARSRQNATPKRRRHGRQQPTRGRAR